MRKRNRKKVEIDKREFKIKEKKGRRSTRQRHSRRPFAKPWDHRISAWLHHSISINGSKGRVQPTSDACFKPQGQVTRLSNLQPPRPTDNQTRYLAQTTTEMATRQPVAKRQALGDVFQGGMAGPFPSVSEIAYRGNAYTQKDVAWASTPKVRPGQQQDNPNRRRAMARHTARSTFDNSALDICKTQGQISRKRQALSNVPSY